ncbi:FKBP-type peptidyl-prolyl cis-trans isomerase N-terminal domain-containing protein [Solilutibacter tolerans]|uniref:Peptidyl-prolyl cis-trans isomerase n=1 Tax=Solilutibacter tolerans TaxID=1604334 RepID=A0A1N6P8F3_9GAMM|nr:FKBP-type peptidyl-prolyl cis-trans isomerase N-terminal domain-containing protein [Lysobacter tolerans]SIQ00442.1 peptidylprolyl isomerase [Lysobacter tolerans]
MKLRLLAAAVAALTLTAGVAGAQDLNSEKGKLSYAFGYDFARNLAESGEPVDNAAVIKAVQDGLAKKDPAITPDQAKPALEAFQKRQQAKAQAAQAEYNKIAGENRTKSTQYLNQYKTQAGVKTLPGGVMYRVLENGTGRKPALTNTVSLQVLGPLPYGTRPQQAVQPQTPNVKVSEIEMQAMRDVITQMPMGSKWEVVLPPEKAFGADPRSGFPPNVAVAFEIKLVNVQ